MTLNTQKNAEIISSAFLCARLRRLRSVISGLLSQIVQYIRLTFLYQAVNHFTKQCIYPSKP